MTTGEEAVDGPWRCSAGFRVAVLAEVGDLAASAAAARMASALAAAGMGVVESRALPPGHLRGALHRAASGGTDLLLLDARTTLAPEAVAELRRAADRDPMIAAALPRFAAMGGPVAAFPDLDYALLPDRRCTYLKASALAALGEPPFTAEGDELAGPLLALARVGFRVAVAGRAAALHAEGAAPLARVQVSDDWRPALRRRATSAPAAADALMETLRPGPDGRRAVAFDLGHAGASHSGTTLLARALVTRAAARWPDLALHVVATPAAYAFHFGEGCAAARVDPADPRRFAALVRFGQPFLWGEIEAAARRAPVLVLFMLDTIGLDCPHDAPDELDALWRFCLWASDGLLFNSAFTARQFARRFGPPLCPARPSLHSLDLADYRLAPVPEAPEGGTVLLVGNSLPHKRLRQTAELLTGAGLGRPVIALGLAPGAVRGVEGLASGGLSPERVAALYAAARAVVYPSLYEGFGFPILDALAHRRPVLVRDLPPYAEICAGLPERANVHRFRDDADLLRLLADPPRWTEERVAGPARTWDDALADLRAVLDAALAGADHARVVRRIDALRGRMSYMRARASGDGDGGDELDRLAGLSGRAVYAGLLWLGRHLPGTRTALAALHRGLDRLRARRARRR